MKVNRLSKITERFLWEQTNKLSVPDLQIELETLEEMNETNCSWVEFELKDILTKFIKNQIQIKKEQNP